MEQNGVLECFMRTAKYIPQLVSGKVGIVISNREKWLLSLSIPEIANQVVVGDPIKDGSAVYQAMKKKQRVVVEVPKEVYGIPYIAISMPIVDDNGLVIGAVAVHESLERKETLLSAAGQLSKSAGELSSSTQAILAQAQELAASGSFLKDLAIQANKEVSETDNVVAFIKNVAKQTNLLGLNAAIEAARVGDQGRGFGVVADEVRKLAIDSAGSASQITGTLGKINESIKKIVIEIEQVDAVSQHQADTIQQLTAHSQELIAMSEQLTKLAADLNKQ
ncbi:methyl-accepting chemotaxis protein [Anaerospora sp.]|jgi:hypothetical protein|uniref:methyl-accepting chemotaxis protein n=1 Tax=Anaerospora sp. TaxID=1960278 RepID=UPI00289AB664|nr:methyl-accepting chemotaxis protein [Anaerospora sp.]